MRFTAPEASLTEVFAKYPNTDKATTHSYDRVYQHLFAPIRFTTQRVLEIGVWEGDSLRAWADWFPKAHIVGIDIAQIHVDDHRITVHEADVFKPETVIDAVARYGEFDIIIDDGPHTKDAQIAMWLSLSPSLHHDQGIYVIEDVQSIETAYELAEIMDGEILDCRAIKGRYDDLLVVKKRP